MKHGFSSFLKKDREMEKILIMYFISGKEEEILILLCTFPIFPIYPVINLLIYIFIYFFFLNYVNEIYTIRR